MKLFIIHNQPAIFVEIKANQQTLKIRALIDTGSDAIIIDKTVALRLGLELRQTSKTGFGFLKNKELWECSFTLEMENISKQVKAYAVDFPLALYNLNLIIGWKLFANLKLCLDFKNNKLEITS